MNEVGRYRVGQLVADADVRVLAITSGKTSRDARLRIRSGCCGEESEVRYHSLCVREKCGVRLCRVCAAQKHARELRQRQRRLAEREGAAWIWRYWVPGPLALALLPRYRPR